MPDAKNQDREGVSGHGIPVKTLRVLDLEERFSGSRLEACYAELRRCFAAAERAGVEREREACAKIVELFAEGQLDYYQNGAEAEQCAGLIRARKGKP